MTIRWPRVIFAEPLLMAGAAGVAPVRSVPARSTAPHRAGSDFSGGSRPPNFSPKRWFTVSSGLWVQIGYVLIDIFFVCLNTTLVYSLRFGGSFVRVVDYSNPLAILQRISLTQYGGFLLLYIALIVMSCQSQDLYRTLRTRTSGDESRAVAKAVTFATILLIVFIYILGVKTVSRLVVVCSGLLTVGTLIAWRLWKRQVVTRRVSQGIGARNAVIVGAGRVGRALAQYLEENKQLGYRFTGFLDENPNGHPKMLGRVEDLGLVARAEFVDDVFITIPSERELVMRVETEARRYRLNVKVVPELYDGLGWNAPMGNLGHFPVMELHREPIPAVGLLFKRWLDVVASAGTLVMLSPVLLIIAIAIKLDSAGTVFYRSKRMGKKGNAFVCFKFRTMVADADGRKDDLRWLNERDGPFFKITDDPRVTSLGRFLRKYSLDELPQFWNVLRGEMSMVGPRPHPLDDYEQYSLEHLRRLDVKPGITGLWQITARRDPSFETNMRLDIEYIENWNAWLDFKILLKTLPEVLLGVGR